MAKNTKHIQPSHEQLRRYAAGELTPAEQHRVEKAALQNEQTDDAVEGLLALKKENVDEKAALSDLRQRLYQRVQKNERRLIPFYYAGAASVVLAVGLGWWLTQKGELSEKVSSTIALQRPAPVIQPEAVPGSAADNQPFLAAPSVAEVPKPSAGKPTSRISKVIAVPEAAQQRLTEEPLPTVALEEKRNEISAPTTASETLQSLDSGQSVATKAPMPNRIAAAPAAALSKRNAFSAVNREAAFTIRGKVLAENQEALPGVALQIKNQLLGVSTDSQGNFVIPNVRKGDEISISSVGFEEKRLTVNDSIIAPIVLKENTQALSEVVVTATHDKPKMMTQEVSPKNGWKKYRNYLENAAKAYIAQNPQASRGRVRLSFVVNSTGDLTDFKGINKADAPLFEEAVRIIKTGDSWEPGLRNGQKVPDKINMTIDFK
jgi:CarboxypepD_reg-like domain/Gram-negative bacterial TonB protein C-terminal